MQEDFADLAEGEYSFIPQHGHINIDRLIAPGIVDTSGIDYWSAQARKYDLAYRTKFELHPYTPESIWNYIPLPYMTPDKGYKAWSGFYHAVNAQAGQYMYEPQRDDVSDVLLAARRDLAAALGRDERFMAMQGSGEVSIGGIPFLMAVANSPHIKSRYRNYLKDTLKLDLAGVGERYHGDPKYYASWDEVTIPLLQEFVCGEHPVVIDDEGWVGRFDAKREGEKLGLMKPDNRDPLWHAVDPWDPILMAGIDALPSANPKRSFWIRRTITLTKEQCATSKYVHLAAPGALHRNNFDVYINGQKLKDLTNHHPITHDYEYCYAVGDTLHPGDNTIVINTHGGPLFGYLLFSDRGPWIYPGPNPGENLRFYDAIDFEACLRMETLERSLAATRSALPERPLQIMSPQKVLDKVHPLLDKYGAYPHDTGGASANWSPWYSGRHAWNVPMSSEPGGPTGNVNVFNTMLTLNLLMGSDIMELIGTSRDYLKSAPLRKWLAENRNLTRMIGKLSMPCPRLGVLRSTRQIRLNRSAIWGWDIARGSAQAVGRQFGYVELDDFANGMASRHPVIFDAATENMTKEDVAAIERYVRNGGTFVALHLTGKDSPDRADSWPISRLTHLKAHELKGYRGELRFAANEDLFPSLAGKKIVSHGMALDWIDNDISGKNVALSSDDPEGLKVIATWTKRTPKEGNIAIAERRIGKGRVIVLGSMFWRNVKDRQGLYKESDDIYCTYLDEMLTALGVPRESTVSTKTPALASSMWAQTWQSKNGLYDIYMITRHQKNYKAAPVDVRSSFPGAPKADCLWELGKKESRQLPAAYEKGNLTIPTDDMTAMDCRLFAALRPEVGASSKHWFAQQQKYWHELPPVEAELVPPKIAPADDLIPLAEEWRFSPVVKGQAASDTDWRLGKGTENWATGRLGTFAALDLDEYTPVRFYKTVEIPKEWRGKDLELVFDSRLWFYGIMPWGKVWINGKPLNGPDGRVRGSFRADIEAADTNDVLHLALEIAADDPEFRKLAQMPAGVTGMFSLRKALTGGVREELQPPFKAAVSMNEFKPVKPGDRVKCVYLSKTFVVPAEMKGKRIFLTSNQPLGFVCLNSQAYMLRGRKLDVTGILQDGKNILEAMPVEAWPTEHPRPISVPTYTLVGVEQKTK